MSRRRQWITTIVVLAVFVVAGYLALSGMGDFRGAQDALMSPRP